MRADHHRIARDPRNSALYYSKSNGEIYRTTLQPGNGTSTSTKLYGGVDHGISDRAQGISPWAKAGVMFRQSTVANAPNVFMMVSPTQGTGFQMRTTQGAATTYVPGPAVTAAIWLKVARHVIS